MAAESSGAGPGHSEEDSERFRSARKDSPIEPRQAISQEISRNPSLQESNSTPFAQCARFVKQAYLKAAETQIGKFLWSATLAAIGAILYIAGINILGFPNPLSLFQVPSIGNSDQVIEPLTEDPSSEVVINAEFEPVEGGWIAPSWFPERDTDSGPRQLEASLNSRSDHPLRGDERAFVQFRALDNGDSTAPQLSVELNSTYEMRIYFANNATQGVGAAATDSMLAFDGFREANGQVTASAILSSAETGTVGATGVLDIWDDEHDSKVVVHESTATLHVGEQQFPLGEGFFDGQPVTLGCNQLDGTLPPGEHCSGYASVHFSVVEAEDATSEPALILDAAVQPFGNGAHGALPYQTTIAARPGEQFTLRIRASNQAGEQLDGIHVTLDDLPAPLVLTEPTSYISNSSTDGDWIPLPDPVSPRQVFNIGSHSSNAATFLAFLIEVDDIDHQEECVRISLTARDGTGTWTAASQVLVLLSPDVPVSMCQ